MDKKLIPDIVIEIMLRIWLISFWVGFILTLLTVESDSNYFATLIGVICWFVCFIITQIIYFINGYGWVFNPKT